jgi:hypothetical protein
MLILQAIDLFSEGIALAEGFYVTGSRAARNHNPGNITRDITNTAIGTDGMFMVYADDADGWDALHKQVSLILTDASTIYNSDMTLREIGQLYASTSTPDEQLNWALNVASKLGIDIDTPVSQLLTEAVTVGAIGLGTIVIFVVMLYLTKRR